MSEGSVEIIDEYGDGGGGAEPAAPATTGTGNTIGKITHTPKPANIPAAEANPPAIPETPAEQGMWEEFTDWLSEGKDGIPDAIDHPEMAALGAGKSLWNTAVDLGGLMAQGASYQAAGQMMQNAAIMGATGSAAQAEGMMQAAQDLSDNAAGVNFDAAKATRAGGETYSLERDAAGQVIRETDFTGRSVQYEYDAAGRRTGARHADDRIVRWHYSLRDELIRQEVWQGGETQSALLAVTHYGYDRQGRMIRAQNDDARVEFEFDDAGRLVCERLNGEAVTHQRDTRSDRPLSRAFRGLTFAFEYDIAGRIARMQAGDMSPLEIDYDAGGRERLRRSSMGFVQSQGYSATGMLLQQAAGRDSEQFRHLLGGDGAQMSGSAVNRRWTYDGASNLLSLGDDRWGTSQFDYDSNDQITRSAFGGMIAVEERFGYDANLNIREQSRLPRGAMSSFEQVQQRQVRGRVVSRGEDDYRYDAAGRLTEKCRYRDGYRPQRWRYRWDGYDRLSELMTPSGVRWRYSYDPFGRRIRKQKVIAENRADTRPAGTEYRWSGDQMIAETPVYADGTAAYDESIHWLYAPGALTPVARYQKGQLHYVVSDHMGTPRELLTEQGKVAWAGRLSTWGEVTEWPVAANDADKLSCNLRFAGQYADEESGLHYNRFRYYDNWTGQYLSPDPIGLLGGVNPYGYVTNPLSWVDPLGLVCVCPDKASRELDASANKVTVKSRSDAEQLFLDRYVGDGYRNMTGESGPSTKNLMDFLTNKNTKAGTYHWDDIMDPNNPGRVSGHGAGNPDGDLPHLQVHQNDGKIIHIFFPWE